MLLIDVKTIYAYAGVDLTKNMPESFLGANPLDNVSTCLTDMGYSPVNGRYVIIPSLVESHLLIHLTQLMMGIPTTSIITLSDVHGFIHINNKGS